MGDLFYSKIPSKFDQSSCFHYLRSDQLEGMDLPGCRAVLQQLESQCSNELGELHGSSDHPPPCLKLPLLKEPHNQAITSNQLAGSLMQLPDTEEQPEGLAIAADSESSPALTNSMVLLYEGRGYNPKAFHIHDQASLSTSNLENREEERLPSSGLPFSYGCSQSSYGAQRPKPKRRRKGSSKNSEEAESQRQTHIAVERNRRRQMNEQLSVLRSIIPGSYVPRGDQASIVGGAIQFVRELEQLLECMEGQKRRKLYSTNFRIRPYPFHGDGSPATYHHQQVDPHHQSFFMPTPRDLPPDQTYLPFSESAKVDTLYAESKSQSAEVEIQVTDSNAVMKILSPKVSGQLVKTIAAIENLGMTIMHTNITTVDQTVLYSFSVKLELGCQLATADEIAVVVQRIFEMIHCKIRV